MKKIRLILTLFLAAFSYSAAAENKHIDTAMQLYKAMQTNNAATYAIKHVDNIQSLSSLDKLKFALILNNNLAIYKDIYIKSLETQQIFLKSVSTETAPNKSNIAALFLAEVYLLKQNPIAARKQLSEFEKNQTADKTLTAIAGIYLAWAEKLEKNEQAFTQIITSLDTDPPLISMALDFINIMTTATSSLNPNIIRAAEKQYIGTDNPYAIRFANYAIRIYSHQGKLSDARRILLSLKQNAPSFIEEITQFKHIYFYEPSLIDSVSFYYYQSSQSLLTSLKKDKKYHDVAIYYLSDLDLIIANKSSAKQFDNAMLNSKRLPKALASLREIRQNGHGYLLGKTSRAHQVWEKAVNNEKNNPAISAEAILMCLYLKANCPNIVHKARLKAENGRSKRFEKLNTNVGRYFLLKRENNKAVRLLENALDRSNADGLLMNDPILLLNLAEIYRREKRFSESLQIYFSLGKNFPILRQVQDAVQGEYLLKQRSSGSNSIY